MSHDVNFLLVRRLNLSACMDRYSFLASPPRCRDDRLLDLSHGVVTDLFEFEMREIGHLVGRHDAIDDRRPVGLECLVDLCMQLAGLRRPKSMAAAGPGERPKSGLGNSIASRYAGRPAASASNGIRPKAELL